MRIAACVFGPFMPSTFRNGIGPPGNPFTVTWFNASWMVMTSSGRLAASPPWPTGLEMAIGPPPVGGVDVAMQDPTAGITRKVGMTIPPQALR